jgi:hypothetical protein
MTKQRSRKQQKSKAGGRSTALAAPAAAAAPPVTMRAEDADVCAAAPCDTRKQDAASAAESLKQGALL